jgi:hypothetical protein
MALSSTGITTSLVGNAIGSSSRNVGALCSSPLINEWSKWKPISSNVGTMTIAELKDKNYGISILSAHNLTSLVSAIKDNSNLGYKYNKPTGGPYRLGDFRNYEHNAAMPLYATYKDDEVQNIGGVTSSNHASYEKPLAGIESITPGGDTSSLAYLTKDDIYVVYDTNGSKLNLHRGALVTDGSKSYWYSEKLYWWTTQMQQFAGKTVQVYEFLTNAVNTPTSPYTGNANDRFLALPMPVASIQVKADVVAGSQKVKIIFKAQQRESNTKYYDWELQFSAVGSTYRGGTINNIKVKLCKDNKGINQIATASELPSSLTVNNETTSRKYTGSLYNNSTSSFCWLCLWFDNQLQSSIQAFIPMPDPFLS